MLSPEKRIALDLAWKYAEAGLNVGIDLVRISFLNDLKKEKNRLIKQGNLKKGNILNWEKATISTAKQLFNLKAKKDGLLPSSTSLKGRRNLTRKPVTPKRRR